MIIISKIGYPNIFVLVFPLLSFQPIYFKSDFDKLR